ncbi:hypothetical protein NQ314_012894 [Rhamnusium bicolor]|uniref:Uncharacterized protein n=1 Tax=Rhamnusium bicolor TaxID=1586634 RepID=A0AAV8X9T7_9CUCU|nr:hypothetical protein NQ314_012894 [Rhamnusium bicolor]
MFDTIKNGNDESLDRQIDDAGAIISTDIESVSVVTENNFTSKICDSTDISIDINCTTHITMENEEVETNILLTNSTTAVDLNLEETESETVNTEILQNNTVLCDICNSECFDGFACTCCSMLIHGCCSEAYSESSENNQSKICRICVRKKFYK